MKKIILGLVLSTILFACTENISKSAYLSKFEKFISKIESTSVESLNIEKINEQYEKYSQELFNKYKDELTTEEMQKIGKLNARYLKVKLNSGINEVGDQLEEAAEKAKGFVEGLLEE